MLTERQKGLYNFLLGQKCFYSQFEIWVETDLYDDVEDFTYATKSTWDNFHDSAVRHAMTADIQAINQSDEVDKIIISTPQGIKIATEEEFKEYLDREFASIFRKLKRTYAKTKKANLNGQYNFKAQMVDAFYETFNK